MKEKMLTNEKETKRAIKAAVDNFRTFLKKKNENTNNTRNRRNNNFSSRRKR